MSQPDVVATRVFRQSATVPDSRRVIPDFLCEHSRRKSLSWPHTGRPDVTRQAELILLGRKSAQGP